MNNVFPVVSYMRYILLSPLYRSDTLERISRTRIVANLQFQVYFSVRWLLAVVPAYLNEAVSKFTESGRYQTYHKSQSQEYKEASMYIFTPAHLLARVLSTPDIPSITNTHTSNASQ